MDGSQIVSEQPTPKVPDSAVPTETESVATDLAESSPENAAANSNSPVTPAVADSPRNLLPNCKKPTRRTKLTRSEKQLSRSWLNLNIEQIATENSAGKLLVRDILLAIRKPDWDPRDKIRKPIFRRGIIKVDDLKPGMQLDAQIVNVVDFGVFVDIGLGESSLVHVSQLSNQYVRDPFRFCAVGDVLKVWVSEVDTARRRVKLTAIRPGSKPAAPRSRPGAGQKHTPDKKPYAGKPKGKRSGFQSNRKTARTDYARRKPPKPVKPITDEMLKGDEPMRSFSDLLQFVNKKPGDDKDSKKSKE